MSWNQIKMVREEDGRYAEPCVCDGTEQQTEYGGFDQEFLWDNCQDLCLEDD